ncbi:PaaI family thioesterase [Paenibacillus sp. NPDC058071]|uniref:PaaI family thioesterase n=1 Tax=Paenibacillus sp. NPDC058071 TaxID=3346326 RepID=UPI0036DC3BFF
MSHEETETVRQPEAGRRNAAEYLERLSEEAQASFWGDLGCEVIRAEAGRAVIGLMAERRHMNLIGIVHGGVLMSMLDNAMGLAVMLSCTEEKTVTAHMNTHFLENAKSGRIICEAEIMHRIGRTITLQASVKDEEGRLIAWGSGAYRILSKSGANGVG